MLRTSSGKTKLLCINAEYNKSYRDSIKLNRVYRIFFNYFIKSRILVHIMVNNIINYNLPFINLIIIDEFTQIFSDLKHIHRHNGEYESKSKSKSKNKAKSKYSKK